MPTFRDRTSTSSAVIAGTSSSRTAACRGSSNTSAFMPDPLSLVDQNLDLVCCSGGEPRESVGCVVQRDAAGHDALDGQAPGADLRRDPVEVVDPVAPRPNNGEVVERPEHRLDGRLADEQPRLRERAAPAERPNCGVETGGMSRALDGHVDPEP